MPVQPTYPGVYVQEIPSGVHTITGVSTSIAAFIGRSSQGPVNSPQLCLSYSDFDRTFGSDTALSDMPRAVKLFFLNGGTECYVTRIVQGGVAQAAKVTLNNMAGSPVLEVNAISPGVIGNTIRMSVSYNTQYPESTFNLTVFTYAKNSSGQQVMSNVETYANLSMNLNNPKYAITIVNANSNLITLKDLNTGTPPEAYSQAGRPILLADLLLLVNNVVPKNSFQMSIDGGAPVNISLPNLTTATAFAQIQSSISGAFSSAPTVTADVTQVLTTGPEFFLKLKVTGAAEVRIIPAANSAVDLASALMLGTNQGGVEASAYATARPAPNGIVFDINRIPDFDSLKQSDIATLNINGTNISTGFTLPAQMYVNNAGAPNNPSDGLREKWNVIANAVNNPPTTPPGFSWAAEVWGSRLALIPMDGDENRTNLIKTAVAPTVPVPNPPLTASTNFIENVRYYSLGTSGKGAFQISTGTTGQAGVDGGPPTNSDYNAAYAAIDKNVDLFNLMILPKDNGNGAPPIQSFYGQASIFCQQRRAFLLMDPPDTWTNVQKATDPFNGVNSLRIGLVKDYSAVFFPRITISENSATVTMGPSGAIAGLMARIDSSRGVWKAPAGTEADLRGISGLEYRFTDAENGITNPHAVNTLRIFPDGIVNWGSRTTDGDDDFGSEYKHIPIRRIALYIEESLYRGLKWVVFEPNDEPLWASIRLNVGAFMQGLFRQGAFQGKTKQDAYFVKCDSETTTQNDIDLGKVNIWVGFAPLKPAEFVILSIQQMAGQIQV